MGAGVARLAGVLVHRGEVHGLVYFAPGLVCFVAPAGASVATIRAARTLVELPGLLLRGHDVETIAEIPFALPSIALVPARSRAVRARPPSVS